ncbi:MAG: hypothetical protein WDN31_05190 [Hyphomicrobium sp.]
MVQSFDFRTLHAMHKLAPEIRLVALYTGTPKGLRGYRHGGRHQVVSPEYHLVDAGPSEGRA